MEANQIGRINAEHKVNPLSPAGLPEAEMTPAQKEMLHRLISEYQQDAGTV